jgi:hypothetical protein
VGPAAVAGSAECEGTVLPATNSKSGQASNRDFDRLLKVCIAIFVLSTAVLIGFAVYAVVTRQVGIYLHAVGVIYLMLSVGFLAVVAVVFVQSHFVSSREVEAPKLELFEMEKLK